MLTIRVCISSAVARSPLRQASYKDEKRFGKPPTQKPLYLLERILLASTVEGNVVLDPFCGSSTTGVACKHLKRNYIGIDNNAEYIKLSKERLENE